MTRKMVQVLWADAHANEDGAWVYLKSVKDEGEYIVESIGWLLEVGDGGQSGHVTIAQSIGVRDNVADHIINIPNGMVRSLRYLSAGKTVRSFARKQRGDSPAD